MALTGELSDLSLAELIEFFCNQRKSGRLKVVYAVGAGYFYLKSGSVVHARFGDLRGIDAVYYALTQSNASFTFSPAIEAPEQTIKQPWASVVLEGLRRMDESIQPPNPFANRDDEHHEQPVPARVTPDRQAPKTVKQFDSSKTPVQAPHDVKAFGVLLSQSETAASFSGRRWGVIPVVVTIVVLIAAVGVPWGWYTHYKAAQQKNDSTPVAEKVQDATLAVTQDPMAAASPTPIESPAATDTADSARSQREARAKERASATESANVVNNGAPAGRPSNSGIAKTQPASPTSAKKVTVQVSYDENGRVTQASGGDATALRIARQKRFPPGKAGSATITIPIN
jgi:hypothetical protein